MILDITLQDFNSYMYKMREAVTSEDDNISSTAIHSLGETSIENLIIVLQMFKDIYTDLYFKFMNAFKAYILPRRVEDSIFKLLVDTTEENFLEEFRIKISDILASDKGSTIYTHTATIQSSRRFKSCYKDDHLLQEEL